MSEADALKLTHWALLDAQEKIKRQGEEIERLRGLIRIAGEYLSDETAPVPYCVFEEFMRIRAR